jgi:hypothetical protein
MNKNTGSRNNQLVKILYIFTLTIAGLSFMVSCAGYSDDHVHKEELDKEVSGMVTDNNREKELMIPPVDLQVPDKMETATLAMG